MATAKYETEKFTGKNDFGLWRIKMRAILTQQGLSDALEGDKLFKEGEDKLKRAEMLEKAHSTIILCLGDRVLREVARETSAAAVWSKLESLYMTKSLANRLYAKQRLYSFKILDDKSIADQVDEFNKIVDDLENIEVKLEDEDKAIILLNALPKSYEHIRDAMLYGREATITLDEVQSALRSKEMQKASEDKQGGTAESLNVKPKPKKKFKKHGADGKFNAKKGGKEDDGRETRSCRYCKKPGHLKKDCYALKKKNAQKEHVENTADVAEHVDDGEMLNIVDQPIENQWILDSGCTFHMCPHKDWFINIKHCDEGSVMLGNDHTCPVKGIGNIKMKMHDGAVRILQDVRYIPKLKRNLISLGTLEAKGCSFTSQEGELHVVKNSISVMRGIRHKSLYYLDAVTVVGESENNVVDKSMLWHARLGHVGEKALNELLRQQFLEHHGKFKVQSCDECILAKSKKLPYPTSAMSADSPLDYVHADLWGPSRTESVGGGKYFLSLMDHHSRKLWLYVLKRKGDCYTKFVGWYNLVVNEKNAGLKCLRTDNGLEFLSGDFHKFCVEKGVKRHMTVPANPQQNGLIERMNRTILERVRAMLAASGMPKKFWGFAADTACYLINRCPSSSIGFKTPNEMWGGMDVDYSHLRIFGCLAYVHVRQDKLDPRALKCCFIGYPKGVKGYRLWCLEAGKQKVIVSRDVVFKENIMPYFETAGTEEKGRDRVQVELGGAVKDSDSETDESEDVVDDVETTETATDELADYQLARDRTRRAVRPPDRYGHADLISYALNVAEDVENDEPKNYTEAVSGKERQQWMKAMREELDSLMKNTTWILVEKPKNQRCIGCKWIFKKKLEVGGSIRYKARLVAKGFTQKEGIDFNEVFSPVVKHCSIRMLLAIVVQHELQLQQMDVKTAFLHGDLEEKIFMVQPEGFILPEHKEKVCLLKKSLYGLKQSSRQWYLKFDQHMMKIGFERSRYDSCVYLRRKGDGTVTYLLLYVDDMLLASKHMDEINKVKSDLRSEFEMKDLGDARRILGMDIFRNEEKGQLWLIQHDYILKILKRFNMLDSKEVRVPLAQHFKLSVDQRPSTDEDRRFMAKIPYANIVGSVMYTMVCTRPDVAHAVSLTSRFMAEPGKEHWAALKWILRYLKGTSDYGLLFEKTKDSSKEPLMGYVDSDYAANVDSRKSQSGYIFTLFGTAVSWKSVLQSVVALSTTEVEYMAMTEAVKEAIWLKGMLAEFGIKQKAVAVKCDNQSAIHLVKHQVFHERSKHIDVRLHFVRDIVNKGMVKVEKVSTEENASDMLTKALPAEKFRYCSMLVKVLQQHQLQQVP